MGEPQRNEDERTPAGADRTETGVAPDAATRQPRPRDEEHEVTHGARFRAGQDSVQVTDSGVPASRAYGVEGATAEDADADED